MCAVLCVSNYLSKYAGRKLLGTRIKTFSIRESWWHIGLKDKFLMLSDFGSVKSKEKNI